LHANHSQPEINTCRRTAKRDRYGSFGGQEHQIELSMSGVLVKSALRRKIFLSLQGTKSAAIR
jgi:hypothetical protein